MSSEHIQTMLDAQYQREKEALAQRMRELKRQEACEQLAAWEGAARELGRQEAREQLPAAVSAASEAAASGSSSFGVAVRPLATSLVSRTGGACSERRA